VIFPIKANVSVGADVARLFETSLKQVPQIDFLINNAGVLQKKMFADFTEEEFDKMFTVNTKGTFLMCKEAIKTMKSGGRIINFSTSLVGMNIPSFSLYSASKAAVEQMSRVLAKELGSKGITVNVIAPGPVDTELFRQGTSEGEAKHIAGMAAMGRLGLPNDIASFIAVMLSADSAWLDGQVVRVNGGFI